MTTQGCQIAHSLANIVAAAAAANAMDLGTAHFVAWLNNTTIERSQRPYLLPLVMFRGFLRSSSHNIWEVTVVKITANFATGRAK